MSRSALCLLVALLPAVVLAGERGHCFLLQGRQECLVTIGQIEVGGRCAAKGGKRDCDATRVIARARINQVSADELAGGKEAGAVLCGKLSGDVAIGTDRLGNEQGFCVFGDGTFLTTASLWSGAESHGRPASR